MAIYECDRCGHKTNIRSRMNAHLLKKYPCKKQKVLVNWPIMKLINTTGIELIKLEADLDLIDKELFQI
jgi:hypothetical protein